MKTYSEERGHKPFNWNEFLNRSNLSSNDFSEVAGLAYDWVTCACGNHCSAIPRNFEGEPLDTELSELGNAFYCCIRDAAYVKTSRTDGNWKAFIDGMIMLNSHRVQALKILNQIEQRSSQLITEMHIVIST